MIPECAYTVLFWLLATGAVLLALAVVNSRRLLRAAIYLLGVLGMSAGFYVMLDAEFLAGVQILVYMGGIVVLIAFAVMLTHSTKLYCTVNHDLAGATAALCAAVAASHGCQKRSRGTRTRRFKVDGTVRGRPFGSPQGARGRGLHLVSGSDGGRVPDGRVPFFYEHIHASTISWLVAVVR